MILKYSERTWKIRVVTDFMGFYESGALLYCYKDKAMVPGICVDKYCEWIRLGPCDEETGWYPCCEAETIQSILIFACAQAV